MKRSVLLAMGVVVTLQLASAQNPVPTYADVDYVGDGDEKHFLDVYIPPGISEPAPTVVFIHGGGWRSGSKSTAMPHCRLLYEAGYVVVSIDYRLSQDSIFPAQIYDCKTAIRFLRTHAGEYLVDTCNIGVAGKSAGGHLVALLGTSNGVPSLEGLHLGSTGVSSDVQAVADFYGPTDFLEMDGFTSPNCTDPLIHDLPNSPESLLLGCHISSCPERVAEASPLAYIDGNEPPFSIHHGDADCTVPLHQSELLYGQLLTAGQSATLDIYPDGGHGNFINPVVLENMVAFFDSTLVYDCSVTTGVGSVEVGPAILTTVPNPVREEFVIQGLAAGEYRLILCDSRGQVVQIRERYRTDSPIRLSAIPAGLYFLSVMNEQGRIRVVKIIKA